jgi:hypothetical protein
MSASEQNCFFDFSLNAGIRIYVESNIAAKEASRIAENLSIGHKTILEIPERS